MTVTVPFATSYEESRRRFLESCRACSLETAAFQLEGRTGPSGEALFTDFATLGEADAARVLIISSGTHGIEGFCGAGVQNALLNSPYVAQLPSGVQVLLVHALNPYGLAHLRRTNEDNVDLNRNFIDHDRPAPPNPAYDEIHALLVPSDWEGPARARAEAALDAYRRAHGARALQAAACGGQWDHPYGLFYGGAERSWSNRLWTRILRRYAGQAKLVAAIDFHTGLGERSACELISGAVIGSDEHALARRWFGGGIVFPGGTSTATAAAGFLGASLPRILPDARGALVVAEFGTVPFDEILHVLRADNWLHAHGDLAGPLAPRIKADMLAAFHGDDPQWQSAILERSFDLIRSAAERLAETPISFRS